MVTFVLSLSGALDSEYSTPSGRFAVKLIASPSSWPLIVSLLYGPLMVPLIEPTPENEPSQGFSTTL